MRGIETSSFAALAPAGGDAGADPGAAPMLQWVKIADLVVDEAYQRPIYGAGRKNVRAIAEGFRWSKFAPVIVAPVAGGKFAIIDGQHRTTAAALRGFDTVPAQVIVADRVEQAAAFKSINGQVTQVNKLVLLHAAIAAGDRGALAIDSAAREGGVTILRYPKRVEDLKPGETIALGSIADGLKAYGREVVVLALRCITGSAANQHGGALSAVVLRATFFAVAGVMSVLPSLRPDPAAVLAAFETLDLRAAAEDARVSRREKGVAVWDVLARDLAARLTAALGLGETQAQGAAEDAETASAPRADLPPPAPATRVLTPVRVRAEVLTILDEDPSTPPELAQLAGVDEAAVRQALIALKDEGRVRCEPMPAEGWRAQVWRVAA